MKKICVWVVALCMAISTPVKAAGIPVIDVTNLVQNLLSALEAVAQTAKQIQQYSTQLQQYEDQLKNTASPSGYSWDQSQSTISALIGNVDTLSYYKSQMGSIAAFLAKTQDVDYYTNNPCLNNNGQGCSPAQLAALEQARALTSQSQKKANDALFKGIDSQQTALQADAAKLQNLQISAQNATGRMQAIQAANQFASQQSNQLLQIRAMLLAQQTAVAARNQAVTDKEAQETAADAQFRSGSYTPSTPRSW